MKKIIILMLVACALVSFAGCGEKKALHCDGCNTEVQVDVKSNMEEDWIIYCEECNEEFFGDDPLLGAE